MAGNSAALNFILSLTDKVTGPMAKVNSSFSDLGTVGQNGIKKMGFGLAGLIGTGYAVQAAMGPAIDQQRALGEVKSLGVAADGLDLLNQKSLQFAMNYGENAQAFVRSAYDIQSAIGGLTSEQLATFTNASNVLAKATKADAGTITNYVGTMYGIFKGQADAMGKGEWVENLAGQTASAVQMFKTTGQGMADAFTGVGANATAAGIGLSEQMAILGTMQATMSGGEAGTKYKAFLSGVGSAQKKLGLQFTDSQGAMLPMLDILDKIKGKFGDTLDVDEGDRLKQAFGSDEAVGLIKLLMADTDGLASSINALGKVRGMDQAETMAQAMVDPWARLASTVEVLKISFGQLMGPVLTPLLQKLTEAGAKLQSWTTKFPHLAKALAMVTLGVIALIAAVSALTLLSGLMGVLSVLVSPIALIVLGVIALVVAVGYAIFKWDELKATFGETGWFQALLALVNLGTGLFSVLVATLNFVWVALQQIWHMGTQLVDWFASFEGVATTVTATWNGFLDVLNNNGPFTLVGRALDGLIALLNKIPGINIDTRFTGGTSPGAPEAMNAAEQAGMASKAQQTINDAIPSLLPSRPGEVPPGGLMQSFQNSNTQNRGTHIAKMEIHTSQPMSQHELDSMLNMAAG
jgi:TP901 family phage tail tape measure protein